jgi:hypothetical protein
MHKEERPACDRRPGKATTNPIVSGHYKDPPRSRSTLVAEDWPAGLPSDRIFGYIATVGLPPKRGSKPLSNRQNRISVVFTCRFRRSRPLIPR